MMIMAQASVGGVASGSGAGVMIMARAQADGAAGTAATRLI